MTSYATHVERVTLTQPLTGHDGRKRRTVRLRVVSESDLLLHGIEVDAEHAPIEPTKAHLAANDAVTGTVEHVISKDLIAKRQPVKIDLHYGTEVDV